MKLTKSLIASLVFASAFAARADIKLPVVISSHMVLQREQACPIWGWADPGEEVTVQFAGQKISTKAAAEGTWSVKLRSMKANATPQTMTIAGKNKLTLEDVLVGEVWLCSGQSNMEWPVSASDNAKEEIAAANHPRIRHIKIPHRPSDKPEREVPSDGWQVSSSNTVAGFTAVGYYFGRSLMKELDVPIGLLGCNWGGTRIEPWIPPAGFKAVPALKAEFADKLDTFPAKIPATGPDMQPALDKNGKTLIGKDGKPVLKPVLEKNGRPKQKVIIGADGKPLMTVNHQSALALYNGMVHPLVPFAIRGAIWYQGESNNGEGMLYYEKMKALIAGWRKVWDNPKLPFYYVQLAPYTYGGDPTKLAGIWEAQTAALEIPHTGMAVTVDIGNIKNIHPTNKQETGRRLALWALAKTYGKKGFEYSGPLFDGMKERGGKIELSFDHVGVGLVARDGKPLTHFTIAGEDKNFVEAKAEIVGKKVIVSSEAVAKPVAVRFAWHQQAEPNLSNKDGLPASPFRTEKWPLVEVAPAPAPAKK